MLLDTTVLIDLIRGVRRAAEWSRSWTAIPACSEVSRAEVLRGAREQEIAVTERLLRDVDWIPVSEVIARRAGALGRSWSARAVRIPELLIAATALESERELKTANVRDFPMFPALKPPY
ncbi:MAG: type II toxin-antitoxin system VapC family toxin [Candidatus Dormibacteraeota bacterium]|nr:type II toxin-antitoxin system VapC family toxin [Candidatus Dormibacteraeota bacterium]